MFTVFPIPTRYFGQIPDPENTLPDPDPLFRSHLGYEYMRVVQEVFGTVHYEIN